MPIYTPRLTSENLCAICRHLVAYSSTRSVQVVGEMKEQKNFELARCPIEMIKEIVELLGTPAVGDNGGGDGGCIQEPPLDVVLRGPTDLIAGQYEGGFKIWEGSVDLINHFEERSFAMRHSFGGEGNRTIRVLDLGCGSGNISIYLAQALALAHLDLKVEFYLQDYNLQVLQTYTIANVILNQLADEKSADTDYQSMVSRLAPFHYLYGDWDVVRQELFAKGLTFDLIVTSETIYNEASYPKLSNFFRQCSTRPNGLVYIASKSYYFGCGGGTYAFLEFLLSEQEKESDEYRLHLKENIEIDAPLSRNVVCLDWKLS